MDTLTGILHSRFPINESAVRQTERVFGDLLQRLDKIPTRRK